MAELDPEGGSGGDFGIAIGVDGEFSSTFGGQTPNTELQRTISSTSSATAPSTNWATIHVGFGDLAFEDEIGSNNNRYFYRVRHVQAGAAPSTWLGVVDAKTIEGFRI